jgi:predicted outer membrane repeat protein
LGGGAGISLREAIRYSAAGDTINLPAGTFTLTLAGANEDLGATGDLDITKNLTITGAGAATTTINTAAAWDDRVFHVVTGITFSISGATISGGNTPGGEVGGGIFNEGTLTVANCTFQNNQANLGGAIYNNGTQMTVTGSTFNSLNTAVGGGAIFNYGSGTIDSSIIDNNKATAFGGAGIRNESGPLSITNSSITNNEVTNLAGGGIYNVGTLTIAGTTFSGNKASDATGSFSGGGAIYSNGTLNITNSTLSGNTAVQKGGAIWWIGTGSITNSTITITRPTQTPTTVSMTMAVAYSAHLLRSPSSIPSSPVT